MSTLEKISELPVLIEAERNYRSPSTIVHISNERPDWNNERDHIVSELVEGQMSLNGMSDVKSYDARALIVSDRYDRGVHIGDQNSGECYDYKSFGSDIYAWRSVSSSFAERSFEDDPRFTVLGVNGVADTLCPIEQTILQAILGTLCFTDARDTVIRRDLVVFDVYNMGDFIKNIGLGFMSQFVRNSRIAAISPVFLTGGSDKPQELVAEVALGVRSLQSPGFRRLDCPGSITCYRRF